MTYDERETDALTKMAKDMYDASRAARLGYPVFILEEKLKFKAEDYALSDRHVALIGLLKANCSPEVVERYEDLVESCSPSSRISHPELMELLVDCAKMAIAGRTECYDEAGNALPSLPSLPSNWKY